MDKKTSVVGSLRAKLKLGTKVDRMMKLSTSLSKRLQPDVIQRGRDGAPAILIVSHAEKRCGIHQYGLNVLEALRKSTRYSFAYAECSNEDQLRRAVSQINPTAIIYNYFPLTMPWLNSSVTQQYGVPQLGVMHEVTQEDADVATQELFDYHLCPDPTLEENNPAVFKTLRLIPPYVNRQPLPDVVTIGTFGFGFADKGLEHLMETAGKEFDKARLRLHLPPNDIVDRDYQRQAMATIEDTRQRFASRIEIIITREFLSKHQVLDFLASNTLNAFFYEPHKRLGISSAIEHALAVERPIAITKCGMFRHVLSASPSICIEDASLKQIIANGFAPLAGFREAWSEQNFVRDYERILGSVFSKQVQETTIRAS